MEDLAELPPPFFLTAQQFVSFCHDRYGADSDVSDADATVSDEDAAGAGKREFKNNRQQA